jgi:hypothetical protein
LVALEFSLIFLVENSGRRGALMFFPKLVQPIMVLMGFDVSVSIGAKIGVTDHDFDRIR